MRLNYVLECSGNIPSFKEPKKVRVAQVIVDPTPSTSGLQKASVKKEFSEQEIENLIHEILDTLPHLGDGT